MPTVMTFEKLPNEILVNIFQHLGALDLFNAFAELNFRFQRLIYNVPLNLNFQRIKKVVSDQFCKRMLSNSDMKSRIYSLKLSNSWDTPVQINEFLSLFSLVEFLQLRSLTLSYPEDNEIDRIVSMLPSLSNLCYLCYDERDMFVKKMPTLALPNLRKLVIREYVKDSLLTQNSTFITHMTVSKCALDQVNEIFRYAPLLKYLKLGVLRYDSSSNNTLNLPNFPAVFLTYLNFSTFQSQFNHIEYLFKQTPNLKTLILLEMSDGPFEISGTLFNAYRWQNLITSFLPHLNTFKFHFQIDCLPEFPSFKTMIEYPYLSRTAWKRHAILEGFKQFQSNFWTEQHHWFTAVDLKEREANIFTVPYFCRYDYTLTSDTELFCDDSLVLRSKFFENVRNLEISPNAAVKHPYLKFSNVILLTLEEDEDFWSKYFYRLRAIDPIEPFKNVVNLLKLEEIHIAKDGAMRSPFILLEIFKEAPHLSSISIYPATLIALLDNYELYEYFNKMITKLFFYHKESDWSISFDKYERIWKIFSNIEKLTCKVHRLENVVELLNYFPKLSSLRVSSQTCFDENPEIWLKNNLSDSDGNFCIKNYGRDLCLWISRRSTSLKSFKDPQFIEMHQHDNGDLNRTFIDSFYRPFRRFWS